MSTIAEVAIHLDLSERRVRELQGMNVLPKAARGDLDCDVCRVAYIRYLRDLQPEPPQPGDLDPAQERARKDKALAETAELRNAVTRGELVRYDDVERDVREILLATRERFLAVPVEVQTDMPPEVAQLAHDVVRNRLYVAMEDMAADGDAQVLAEAEARKAVAKQAKQRRSL
ncbi:hypothetical protein [Methylobacterium pseudosasicola]|nr:hypothetical protein [Methylobacterium pseudosasicola]